MPTRGARRKAAKQRVAKIPKGNEENEQDHVNRDQQDYEGNQNGENKRKRSKGKYWYSLVMLYLVLHGNQQ